MSRVYGVRDHSVHKQEPTNPEYARNPHILKWWTEEHDRLLVRLIERDQWIWYWAVTEEVRSITPEHTIREWVAEDPIAGDYDAKRGTYAWYNVLMYFARARAEQLGLTDAIRTPEWKRCPLCEQFFVEDSLWVPMARMFGVNNIVYCSPCLEEALFRPGNPHLSNSQCIEYVKELARAIGRPPSQTLVYKNSPSYLREYRQPEDRIKVIPLLKRKPTLKRVKELFGSWQGALKEAGVKP